MATQMQMIQALIDKIEKQAKDTALIEQDVEYHRVRAENLKQWLQHEREHHEQTTLRNQTLQIWKDHLEQQCLAARDILVKAANYTDIAIAFELADLSRKFFGKYPVSTSTTTRS